MKHKNQLSSDSITNIEEPKPSKCVLEYTPETNKLTFKCNCLSFQSISLCVYYSKGEPNRTWRGIPCKYYKSDYCNSKLAQTNAKVRVIKKIQWITEQ